MKQKQEKRLKPRNPLVAQVIFKKAGWKEKSGKAQRRDDKIALRRGSADGRRWKVLFKRLLPSYDSLFCCRSLKEVFRTVAQWNQSSRLRSERSGVQIPPVLPNTMRP
jgi:hypothetical protein